ncbi:hypothetical protein PROFUN_02320 [Planoprotostelium fungivorum]|uniref:Malonyl-CoA decarboxylase C-terminal domain-containing protein n=1 Tax=Planoprotostelium fungivorum TaxID=1890364 RepID=A0A2P6NYN5_9EUKA|nr:hypothetical protein PROFUN_02320 [Planoprotostelium fungivorum]
MVLKKASHVTIQPDTGYKEGMRAVRSASLFSFEILTQRTFRIPNVSTTQRSLNTEASRDVVSMPLHRIIDRRRKLLTLMSRYRMHIKDDEQRIAKFVQMESNLKDELTKQFTYENLSIHRLEDSDIPMLYPMISSNEHVHPLYQPSDLQLRIKDSRRVYILYHPNMAHDKLPWEVPLGFCCMSLREAMPKTMKDIYSSVTTNSPSYAVFYSINSTQKGLSGIEMGHFLLKKIISELQRDAPDVNRFCTFSPIPNFRNWLGQQQISSSPTSHVDHLLQIASPCNDQDAMHHESTMMELCAHYLHDCKRKRHAADPVAHFHLKNGAMLGPLFWAADGSPLRKSQSFGMMVSYIYHLQTKEKNADDYLQRGKIAVSDQFPKNKT